MTAVFLCEGCGVRTDASNAIYDNHHGIVHPPSTWETYIDRDGLQRHACPRCRGKRGRARKFVPERRKGEWTSR